MRHRLLLAVVVLALAGVSCAGSSRADAQTQFIHQLERDGGLTHAQAVCVADRFFGARTDQELKDFFARKELTEPEQAEFAKLGNDCAKAGATVP